MVNKMRLYPPERVCNRPAESLPCRRVSRRKRFSTVRLNLPDKNGKKLHRDQREGSENSENVITVY